MSSPLPLARHAPTAADWATCQDVARRHGRSFWLASRLLPPERQRAVLATYAFCRIADDIVDRAGTDGLPATIAALDAWERQLDVPEHPVAIAFAASRARYDMPDEPVRHLLAGVRMDIVPARYETWDDLRSYCYHVAGTVGLMVAPILGCEERGAHRHAAELGIAMQLTNILRDVAEDAAMGRLYLPLEDIARFGCDPDEILAGRPGPGFRNLMAFQIERARELYDSAMAGVCALAPSGRFATIAAANLYAGILDEIEAMDHDVFRGRAIVPAPRKLRSVALASASAAWMSVTPQRRRFNADAPVPGRPLPADPEPRYRSLG